MKLTGRRFPAHIFLWAWAWIDRNKLRIRALLPGLF